MEQLVPYSVSEKSASVQEVIRVNVQSLFYLVSKAARVRCAMTGL